MTTESMNKHQKKAFRSWERKGFCIESFDNKGGVVIARNTRDDYGDETHRLEKKLIDWNGDVKNIC